MNIKFKAQSLNRKSDRKFTLSCSSVTCFKHVGLLWPISALDRKQVRGYNGGRYDSNITSHNATGRKSRICAKWSHPKIIVHTVDRLVNRSVFEQCQILLYLELKSVMVFTLDLVDVRTKTLPEPMMIQLSDNMWGLKAEWVDSKSSNLINSDNMWGLKGEWVDSTSSNLINFKFYVYIR